MIPEIGNFAIIVALLLALLQGVLPIYGAARSNNVLMGMARPVAVGHFVFVAIAFACLARSFLVNDFSVLYVAEHSNSQLPLHYRFAAIWGGHEGSLLLWTFILSVWTVAVAKFSKHLPDEMVARVIGVMGLVSVGFLLFMLLTSNPFDRLLPAAADGADLNPLLQDPGLVIHPPMLYMGYVGFSVAFAFALSALIGGQMDASLGALVATLDDRGLDLPDLRHHAGQLVGILRTGLGWLVVLGSGRERLIHAMAGGYRTDPFAGGYGKARRIQELDGVAGDSGIFAQPAGYIPGAFRRVDIGAFVRHRSQARCVHSGIPGDRDRHRSLLLFAWRAPKIGLGGKFDMVSRESMLLSNNVLLSVASASVFIGTLYPLFMDALGWANCRWARLISMRCSCL